MQFRIEGLTRVFGTLTAVDDVSFTMSEGEIWGFIGPNGAGKTTTLRMLATVDQPTRGDAWVDGLSVTRDADKVRPLIGFMPDFFGAYPDMLVREYLDFFARAYGLHGADRRRRVDQIVEFLEISGLLEKRVTDLSKGMHQRMSLARTLIHDPQFLLLDEPAAGLDPQARRDLRELLLVLASEKKTILISSHILSELEDLVTCVAIIHLGKLAYSGTPRGLCREEGMALTLKVTGNLADCARLLLETPNVRDVRTAEPDVVRVRLVGGKEQVAAIVSALVVRNIVPYHVSVEEKVLERMFLEMTRGQGNGADGAA